MSKELLQESQYNFPYHHLPNETKKGFFIFRHLFWGLEHYTYIKFVINEISKLSFSTLSDVGCGEGRILTEIRKITPSAKLYGYDISDAALHFARGFCKDATFQTHDITEAKLEKYSDVIVSCEVIEHIPPNKVDAYCKNIAASLNESGIFVLTTPTTNIPVNKKHYQHFTKDRLEQYLSPYFTIEKVVFLNQVNSYTKILNRILANRFFLSNFPPLNQWVLNTYNKNFLIGDKSTGSRIFILATKK